MEEDNATEAAFKADVHTLIFSKSLRTSEVISAAIVGVSIGAWVGTWIYVLIKVAINTKRMKTPRLTYKKIPSTEVAAKKSETTPAPKESVTTTPGATTV